MVDFSSSRDLSDPNIITATDLPSFVPILENGAFWGGEADLYVMGGMLPGMPYLTEAGQFLLTNNTKASIAAGSVYRYDTIGEQWYSEPAVQPNSGDPIVDTFCCGSVAWNSRLNTGYVWGGSPYAGSNSLIPPKG